MSSRAFISTLSHPVFIKLIYCPNDNTYSPQRTHSHTDQRVAAAAAAASRFSNFSRATGRTAFTAGILTPDNRNPSHLWRGCISKLHRFFPLSSYVFFLFIFLFFPFQHNLKFCKSQQHLFKSCLHGSQLHSSYRGIKFCTAGSWQLLITVWPREQSLGFSPCRTQEVNNERTLVVRFMWSSRQKGTEFKN